MVGINYRTDAAQIHGFARRWFPLFVVALGGMLWWRSGNATTAYAVWGFGALVWVAMLASPVAARFVFLGLMWLTYPIGLVVSYLALGILFFLVFTPIGLVMRLAGRDPLGLRARERATHWLPVESDPRPERAFRQF